MTTLNDLGAEYVPPTECHNEGISCEAYDEVKTCLAQLETIVPIAQHIRIELNDKELAKRVAEHAYQLRHLFKRILHGEY